MIEPRRFGYRPDPHDLRDRPLSLKRGAAPRAVEARDMEQHTGAVLDQPTNSCVGFSGVKIAKVWRALEGLPDIDLSPHGLYWPARALDGFANEDDGAYIRSAAKILTKVGVPAEKDWPSLRATVNQRPDEVAEEAGFALVHGIYERVEGTGADRVERVLDCLQARRPVWFGTDVTSVFMACSNADTIPAPKTGDVIAGGHALPAFGFDRSGERIRVLNSWGPGWGDHGWCWLAAEWFASYRTRDVWTLAKVAA